MSTIARRRSSGFTLVELTLVLILIALLCSVAFPRMVRSIRANGVHESAGVLSDMLRFVRTEAVRRQMRTCFRMNDAGTAYWFEVQHVDAGAADAFKAFGVAVLDEERALPIGIRISRLEEEDRTMSEKRIVFTPDGISRRYRISIREDNGQNAVIEIGPLSDDVSILYGGTPTSGTGSQ